VVLAEEHALQAAPLGGGPAGQVLIVGALAQRRALTAERGWPDEAYRRWLADTLTAALLPPRGP
jgi:hypothetical protein